MEYKYQIGEIVYAGKAAHVITAHGVHLDEGVAIPSYQVTGVNVPVGTRNLPLTDESIHRPSGFKDWYTGEFFIAVDEYLEKLITDNEEIKVKLEQGIQKTEEKIKRFKGLLSPGNDSPSGYVIRTHTGNGEFLGYTSDYSHSKGASKNYSQRKRYPDLSYAAYDAAKYNEINSKKRWYGVEYYCYAVVIPDGTEEECLEATPVWQEEQ